MLMSAINLMLRDKIFEDLDAICEHFQIKREKIEKILFDAGFEYSEKLNKVW